MTYGSGEEMATAALKRKPAAHANGMIPPLENGDHLTAVEFERRFDAMPGLKKAELLEGVVYVPSPVSFGRHGEPHTVLIYWLVHYRAHTPGVRSGADSTVRLDRRNVPQPDGLLFIDPACGGLVALDDEGYIRGGPELVGEVSATTASLDMNLKREVYRRFRVQEYLVWRVLDEAIDWFTLHRRQFRRLPLGRDGIYRSRVLPGLWLDPQALIEGDLDRLITMLEQGLASPEHAAFVERLRSRRDR